MTKDKDIRKRAVELFRERDLHDNETDRELVQYMCGVSLKSVIRWIVLEDTTGSFLPARKRLTEDRSFVIVQDLFDFLASCIQNEPALYAHEMSSM